MHRTNQAAEFASMHLFPTHSVVLANEFEDRDLVVFGELVFSRKLTHRIIQNAAEKYNSIKPQHFLNTDSAFVSNCSSKYHE